MKNHLAFSMALALAIPTTAQFPKSLKDAASKVASGGTSGLSNDEVVAGLKEALGKGAEQSVLRGSALDGYLKNDRIRIPFPPEAEKMKSTLTGIGMSKQVEEFEVTMNRFRPKGGTAFDQSLAKVLTLGEHGVDLFFVLSGFLITGILCDTKHKADYFRGFYIRRA